MNASYEQFESISEIGGIMAESLVNFFANEQTKDLIAKLKNAENLVLPILSEEGKIDLSSLISARGLVLPECINGSLLLNSLMDIEGIMLPKNKKGEFYNPVTEYLICPFDEEELIEAAKRTETKQFELQSSDGNLKL